MRFLFVMDPPQTMLPDKDTTFAFMRAAQARGHECFHSLVQEVGLEGKSPFAYARAIQVSEVSPHVATHASVRTPIREFDAVLIRKDPPFDSAYLHLTQVLDLASEHVFMMNDPTALRHANEKLFAFHFVEFMPRSLVSANTDDLLSFLRQVGGHVVVKPLDGAGGSGVMSIEGDGRHARGILDYVTKEGRELCLIQQFLPSVVTGDKRVLLLNGELLGAIRRIPRADDIRANIHVGGRVEHTELTPAEQSIVDAIGPRLAQLGLYFVGLDLIAEKLIEVNVTSPTGVQQLGRLTNTDPAAAVIEFLEQRAYRR
jgi:glutathione synthase